MEKELKKEAYELEIEKYLNNPEIRETMQETTNFIIKRFRKALDNENQSSIFKKKK